jgi:hypothetical protein
MTGSPATGHVPQGPSRQEVRRRANHLRLGQEEGGLARFVHNSQLLDALMAQAFAALTASPGARAYYDHLRVQGIEHNDALRRLANRLVGILHGCLKPTPSTTRPAPGLIART